MNTGPSKGEPRLGQENTNYIAPYFTVFEATANSGTNWTEIARVADGVGGGYADGFTVLVSLGGSGGETHTAIGTGTTNLTGGGTASLRNEALGGTTSGNEGKMFKKGIEGGRGRTPKHPGPLQFGFPGSGGFIWDGLRTQSHASSLAFEYDGVGNIFFRPGNSVDMNAPGSGGSGCKGDTDESTGANAWGGHAIAGCAWVTYSQTAYDSF